MTGEYATTFYIGTRTIALWDSKHLSVDFLAENMPQPSTLEPEILLCNIPNGYPWTFLL
jgi:hypothetical protein